MAWYLNRALTNFRNAVNARYPQRDKASDGTIGDVAHQATSSDHNPDAAGEPDAGSVDAWDMDVDLRSGRDAAEIEHLKQVFQRHESSRYWIHNRVIASRSVGWKRESYTGSNPHDKHVHWNTRESHENSSAPWVLREDDVFMALTERDQDTLIWRVEALAMGRTAVAGGPTAGEAVVSNQRAVGIEQKLAAVLTAVAGVDEATAAALRAEFDQIDSAVAATPAATVEALGAADSPEEIADRLRAALGDRAAAVGAILAQG